jgi:hypothetical protein
VELVIANTREMKSMAKRLCGITKCVLIFLSTKDRRPFQPSRAKRLQLDTQTWLKRAHMRHLHSSIAVLKNFTKRQANNFICGHAAIGATNP